MCNKKTAKTNLRLITIFLSIIFAALLNAQGNIDIAFSNNLDKENGRNHRFESLTLEFQVDDSGYVTLFASADASEEALEAIQSWNGVVGQVAYQDLLGTTFHIVIDDVQGRNLSLASKGGGVLGISKGSSTRIDGEADEVLRMRCYMPTGKMFMQHLRYAHSKKGAESKLAARSGSVQFKHIGKEGKLELEDLGLVLGNEEMIHLSSTTIEGFGLRGICFDLLSDKYAQTISANMPDEPLTAKVVSKKPKKKKNKTENPEFIPYEQYKAVATANPVPQEITPQSEPENKEEIPAGVIIPLVIICPLAITVIVSFIAKKVMKDRII